MRFLILIGLFFSVSATNAQRFLPGSFIDNNYRGSFANNISLNDSTAKKKWFVSKYSGISTSFSVFKGGSATIVAVPLGLQLNRRLNNNLYAFAGVSVAPAYVNFNQSFLNSDFNKGNAANGFLRSSGLNLYSRAELGLQYVNDEKTFSISGSIGVERSTYSMPGFNQSNNRRYSPVNSAQ